MTRRILTMGGGGFLMEPDNVLLDQFLISMTKKNRPKVCFVPTASGDSQDMINRFYLNMKKHDVEASHLSLFRGSKGSLADFVASQDLLYVGGGNTRNLLVLWREWELDKMIKVAYEKGTVLGGVSAGSICWYEKGVTDSIPGELNGLDCLGLIKGSNCPHYDGEIERRPAYHRLIKLGMPGGLACDDGVAAVFENEKLVEFVSSRSKAGAYRVGLVDGKVAEEKIVPRFLGKA